MGFFDDYFVFCLVMCIGCLFGGCFDCMWLLMCIGFVGFFDCLEFLFVGWLFVDDGIGSIWIGEGIVVVEDLMCFFYW